jgi:hypothetical protein
MAGETIRERNARPPEPLADGLRSVEIAYRTLGKRGVPGRAVRMGHPDALPLQVRVRIADTQINGDMVVALRGGELTEDQP